MCQLSTYFENGKVLEYITGFVCGVESHMGFNIDLTWNFYFEIQIWDLDLQPAYNRFKLTMWLLWCYILRLYTPLSWTLSTLKSIQIQNTSLEHNLNLVPLRYTNLSLPNFYWKKNHILFSCFGVTTTLKVDLGSLQLKDRILITCNSQVVTGFFMCLFPYKYILPQKTEDDPLSIQFDV